MTPFWEAMLRMPFWQLMLRLSFCFVLVVTHTLFWERICFKTGFSRLWAVMTLCPPLALVLVGMLALRTWPVHVAMRDARILAGSETDDDIYDYLREGCRMEHRGDLPAAMARYTEVAARFGDRQPAREAVNYIEALRAKIQRDDDSPVGEERP